jgi:hypothetical protein
MRGVKGLSWPPRATEAGISRGALTITYDDQDCELFINTSVLYFERIF